MGLFIRLQDLLNLIWEEYQKQEQEYNTRLKKHAQEIVKLSDGSRKQIWQMALGGQGAVAAVFVTAVIGRGGWVLTALKILLGPTWSTTGTSQTIGTTMGTCTTRR